MGLMTGNFPPVEPAEFMRRPYRERLKTLTRHWVDYGFGAPKIYAAEWVGTSQLERGNITKTFFKAGDVMRIWASPNKNPSDNRVRLKRMERRSDGWKWQGNRDGR